MNIASGPKNFLISCWFGYLLGDKMIIDYQIESFQVTIIDFLIVFIVELFFFAFVINKLSIKEYLGTLTITSLLKVGFLSLFISWIPLSYSYTFRTVTMFTVLLLMSGCVISSIMFQKELLLPKNEAFNLAFQLSVLSSSAFFMIKTLLLPDYVYVFNNLAESSTGSYQTNIVSSFTNFGGNGVLFVLLGIILFFYLNKNKNKNQVPASSIN